MTVLETIIRRWRAKTPRLHKTVQRVAIAFAALSGTLAAIPNVPDSLTTWAGWAAGGAATLAALLQLTTDEAGGAA